MGVLRTSATVGSSIVRLWVVCLLVLAAAPVMASADDQDAPGTSRATLLSAEREKKAAETTPPERSFVERAPHWYDNQYLLERIIRRRDKVVAYWLTRTNPLDEFDVRRAANGTELTFDNAATRLRLAQPGARYKVRWSGLDNMTGRQQAIGNETESAETATVIPDAAWGPTDASGSRYAVAAIQTSHPGFPHWANPVVVTVRNQNGSVTVVGIERPTEMRE